MIVDIHTVRRVGKHITPGTQSSKDLFGTNGSGAVGAVQSDIQPVKANIGGVHHMAHIILHGRLAIEPIAHIAAQPLRDFFCTVQDNSLNFFFYGVIQLVAGGLEDLNAVVFARVV